MRFWMVVDIMVDFNQTATYLRLEKDDEDEGIGIGFFICSLFSLIIIPICLYLALFVAIWDFTQTMDIKPYKRYGSFFLAFFFSCFLYYVLFPLGSVVLAFISLIKGAEKTHFDLPKFHEGRVVGKLFRVDTKMSTYDAECQQNRDSWKHKFSVLWLLLVPPVTFNTTSFSFTNPSGEIENDSIPTVQLNLEKLRLLECLGEAVPQWLIANAFYAFHTKWVIANDMELFGIPLPLPATHFSILFSSFSITYGIITGSKMILAKNEVNVRAEFVKREVDQIEILDNESTL